MPDGAPQLSQIQSIALFDTRTQPCDAGNAGTDAEVTTFFVRVGVLAPPSSALPGLSASVSITTAKRANVLTVPIQAVTSRAPKKAEQGSTQPAVAHSAAGAQDGPVPRRRRG